MLSKPLLWILIHSFVALEVSTDRYEDEVIFTVFNQTSSFVWQPNSTLHDEGCDVDGKFAIFTHGFEGSTSTWIESLTKLLLKYRGGCVIFMNWGAFSDILDYEKIIWEYWPNVSKLLTKKLFQMESEGISPDNIFMYGHSLGARLVIDAGINFGPRKISQIDACDSAGPGFYLYDVHVDAKLAAKNVQCIHTSIVCGTVTRNCHQDWNMGNCGKSQPASNTLIWICEKIGICNKGEEIISISHNLCNDFYISAFEHDFVANNSARCLDAMDLSTLPEGFKMGYMENRRNSSIIGVIPSPTSERAPFN